METPTFNPRICWNEDENNGEPPNVPSISGIEKNEERIPLAFDGIERFAIL